MHYGRVKMAPAPHSDDVQPDDVDVIDDKEQLIKRDPLIRVFGDTPRIRFLSVLLDATRPLNPTDIISAANVGRKTWYNHADALLETGIVEKIGNAGNSPLYATVNADEDLRVEWMKKVHDWSGAYYRDETRPTSDDE